MKFKSFDLKIKNAELDAFDLLIHCAHLLDIMYEQAMVAGDIEAMLKIVEKMFDANDRYLAVILGLENEEQENNEPIDKQPFGFKHQSEMDSLDTPNSEPGEL